MIYGGHYWAPKWELTGVYHDHEDSPANLRVTLDVLDMWDCLERAHERFTKKQRDQVESEAAPFGKTVKFPGFDGNNEAEFGVIASFLTRDLERFTRFKDRELNSHLPMVAVYMRMLGVFKPLRAAHLHFMKAAPAQPDVRAPQGICTPHLRVMSYVTKPPWRWGRRTSPRPSSAATIGQARGPTRPTLARADQASGPSGANPRPAEDSPDVDGQIRLVGANKSSTCAPSVARSPAAGYCLRHVL